MESYQRALLRHLKAYKNIKGVEGKNIITTIIKQYRKIDEPAFQTGLNTQIIDGATHILVLKPKMATLLMFDIVS
jgi:hypothetical protein